MDNTGTTAYLAPRRIPRHANLADADSQSGVRGNGVLSNYSAARVSEAPDCFDADDEHRDREISSAVSSCGGQR